MKKDCSNCDRERFSIPCYDCLIGNNNVPSRWVEGENYVPETVALRAVQLIERRALRFRHYFAESAFAESCTGSGSIKIKTVYRPAIWNRWRWMGTMLCIF